MKKLLLVLSMFSIGLISFSQNIKKEKPYYPSADIKRAFKMEFGDETPVVWQFVNSELVKAEFKIDKAPAIAYYDQDGKIVYLFQDAAMDELPRKALEKVGGIFADFKIQEIKQTWTENDHCFYLMGMNGDKKRIIRVCPKGTVALYKDYLSKDKATPTLDKGVAGL